MEGLDGVTRPGTNAHRPRLFLDCSMTATSNSRTGIQRVVRNVAAHMESLAADAGCESRLVVFRDGRWLECPDALKAANSRFVAMRNDVEPSWTKRARLRLKRMFYPRTLARVMRRASIAVCGDGGSRPDFRPEDTLLLLDGSWTLPEIPRFHEAKRAGTRIGLVVYDLLPIQYPHFMLPKATRKFREWMEEVTPQVDFFVAISKAVRDEFRDWLRERFPNRGWDPECVSWFPLGADLQLDVAATGDAVRPAIQSIFNGPNPTFVKVCTLDPRKNHATVIDAFEQLWAQHDAVECGDTAGTNHADPASTRSGDATSPYLVFLGRRGWLNESLFERLERHPLRNRRLFWFEDASDAELAYAYEHAQGSIFASFAEGFGLPIIESLGHGLPTFVSDIPVHREVGGDFCEWFDPKRAESLAALIDRRLREGGTVARRPPADFRVPTWDESARVLFAECRRRSQRASVHSSNSTSTSSTLPTRRLAS
ncbi:MAG: glycosyltransferase [Planctomycetota bacterium]